MTNAAPPLAFIDLLAQRRRLGDRIDQAVMGAVNAGQWVMGPQVREFEEKLAAFGHSKLALSCANGTDALVLPMMAWEIGPGDAVFCPSFTFAATAEVVPWTGATPVFVDIKPDTYNIDPDDLVLTIEATLKDGKLTPKAIIAVDLFGQPADYPRLRTIADKYGLKLISDSAQGFGCTLDGKHPIHWADCTTTSFFPAKPLGCYGDGGAVLTDDEALFERMDSLRIHGKATKSDDTSAAGDIDPKYVNARIGMNSRLDTIQAAILLEKLTVFAEEIDLRNTVANRYRDNLGDVVKAPRMIEGGVSTWAQYTIETPERDRLATGLKALGVPTAIYYPIPLHRQVAYAIFPTSPSGLPVTEDVVNRVISLPMHADMDEATQDRVVQAVRNVLGANL